VRTNCSARKPQMADSRREAVFFLLVSYLLILTASLLSHLHTLLLLSPEFAPCPPLSVPGHIVLLGRAGFNPPRIDAKLLDGLKLAEDTLRKGSKSFEVAKLAFGREMRIGLVAIYAWCRVTVSLAGRGFC
jgi:15-cis-phytoene synthase/lycopene beta-cyclase